jgi:hypothetical protein
MPADANSNSCPSPESLEGDARPPHDDGVINHHKQNVRSSPDNGPDGPSVDPDRNSWMPPESPKGNAWLQSNNGAAIHPKGAAEGEKRSVADKATALTQKYDVPGSAANFLLSIMLIELCLYLTCQSIILTSSCCCYQFNQKNMMNLGDAEALQFFIKHIN